MEEGQLMDAAEVQLVFTSWKWEGGTEHMGSARNTIFSAKIPSDMKQPR